MMPKPKSLMLKASQKMGHPITDRAHFAMVELTALEGLSDLIQRAPKAAQLVVSLIRRMEASSGGGWFAAARRCASSWAARCRLWSALCAC